MCMLQLIMHAYRTHARMEVLAATNKTGFDVLAVSFFGERPANVGISFVILPNL